MEYGCEHKYPDGTNAIETVYYTHKGKDGKQTTTKDYEFCELCGKKFCVSD